MNRPSRVGIALALVAAAALPVMRAAEDHDEDHDHAGETPAVAPDPAERIHSVEVAYEIRRDGTVEFEQRFRLGVAGVAIRRGPVLNYLTVFEGPGGLILDNELEILEVTAMDRPKSSVPSRAMVFTTLFIGASDRDLEHRIHEYRSVDAPSRTGGRAKENSPPSSTSVGPLPRLPIEALTATIRLPEGVEVSQYTPSVTGVADPVAARRGPAFESGFADGVLTVRATAALGADRSFFVNLSGPSATFATKSQWLKVMPTSEDSPHGFSAFSCCGPCFSS